jgi:quercetin dioxygenase-like cupin family protein
VEIFTGKPYTIVDAEDNWEIRYFRNENPKQLFWHRDKESREMEVLEGEIGFQFDNCLPKTIKPGQFVSIPEGTYHRVIAKSSFVVKIYKYNT